MSPELTLILAGVVALGVILAALLWPKGQPSPASRAVGPRVHPGRALIDHFEEVGRDSAGRLIAERLGIVEADAVAEKFGKAFAPARPPAPPSPNP